MSENGEIYTAGTDGMDKFHLWSGVQVLNFRMVKVVIMVRLNDMHSENIWFRCSKPSNN